MILTTPAIGDHPNGLGPETTCQTSIAKNADSPRQYVRDVLIFVHIGARSNIFVAMRSDDADPNSDLGESGCVPRHMKSRTRNWGIGASR